MNCTKQLDVPIGLINTTWGGTIVEAWTSGEALKDASGLQKAASKEIEAMSGDKKAMEESQNRLKKWQNAFDVALKSQSDPWQDPSLDDSNWAEINAPGKWEKQGYPKLDGVAWYRKNG